MAEVSAGLAAQKELVRALKAAQPRDKAAIGAAVERLLALKAAAGEAVPTKAQAKQKKKAHQRAKAQAKAQAERRAREERQQRPVRGDWGAAACGG